MSVGWCVRPWMWIPAWAAFEECWGAEPVNHGLVLSDHFRVTDWKSKLFLCHSEHKKVVGNWERSVSRGVSMCGNSIRLITGATIMTVDKSAPVRRVPVVL